MEAKATTTKIIEFDPNTIIKGKVSMAELISCMQDTGLSLGDVAKLTGYCCGNYIAQLKCGTRTPGRKKLGLFYQLSGGKLDLTLYLL